MQKKVLALRPAKLVAEYMVHVLCGCSVTDGFRGVEGTGSGNSLRQAMKLTNCFNVRRRKQKDLVEVTNVRKP